MQESIEMKISRFFALLFLNVLVTISFCADFNKSKVSLEAKVFLDAIDAGDLKAVKEFLADDPTLISIKDGRRKGSFRTPLRLAIIRGNTDVIEFLLSKGANPNERYETNMEPLHEAAKKGNVDTVEVLVKYGADVNGGSGEFRHPPLFFATSREVTEALIAKGARIGFRDKRNSTPLHSIAAYGQTEAAQALLAHGADIEAKDTAGWTPLNRAVNSGQVKMVELLISKGADINVKDARGLTPLNRVIDSDWSLKSNRKEAAKVLLSHSAEYTIRDVAWLGDIKRVGDLLESNPALANDASGMHKEAVIFAAVHEGHNGLVKLLLSRGARLDVRDRYRSPPPHIAAHADVVKVLLNGGADANEKGTYGELALHWAAAKGHLEVDEVLVGAGSQLSIKTTRQRIDMDTMMKETADVVKHELKNLELHEQARQAILRGSSLQIAPPPRLAFAAGDTPLHSAVQWGHSAIVSPKVPRLIQRIILVSSRFTMHVFFDMRIL
jgi:ankyrin repeat protein